MAICPAAGNPDQLFGCGMGRPSHIQGAPVLAEPKHNVDDFVQQRPQLCLMLLGQSQHADEVGLLVWLEDRVGIDLVTAAHLMSVSICKQCAWSPRGHGARAY